MDMETIQNGLIMWALTLPRLFLAFMVLPILSEPLVPTQLRNAVIIVLALFALPLTFEQLQDYPLNLASILFLVLKESVIGFALGYTLSIPFWSLKAAGYLIDMQRGAMSSQLFSQQTEGMTSELGNFLSLFLNVILMTTGGFLLLMQVLFTSYQIWPMDSFIPSFNPEVIKFFLSQLDALMYGALLIAGPIISILLLTDIGLGLVGRFLPSLNIFLQAMPIKSALAFFLFIMYLGFIAEYLKQTFFKMQGSLQILESLMK